MTIEINTAASKFEMVKQITIAFFRRETVLILGFEADCCPYEGLRFINPETGVSFVAAVDGVIVDVAQSAMDLLEYVTQEGMVRMNAQPTSIPLEDF